MKKTLLLMIAATMATLGAQAQKSSSNVGLGLISISDTIKGVQLSPISNVAEYASGLQLASFSNIGYSGMKGVQLSVLNNIVIGDARGLQLTGLYNQNIGTLHGVQIGLRNQTDTLRGVQIGLVNYISKDYRKGVQIGLMNYSRDTLTKRFGLINVNPKTRIDIMGFAGTNSKINFALRFRNRSTYNIVGVGTHYMGLDSKFSGALYYRIGQYFQLSPKVSISGDLGYAHIETFKKHSDDAPERLYSIEARINLDYQLNKHWGLFGSVGYGQSRYYSHNRKYRNRMLGEIGVTYRYGGYDSSIDRVKRLHDEADMQAGDDNRFALPPKKNWVRTGAMIFTVNAFVQRFDAWVLREDFAKISIHSVKHNFRHAFVWDNDNFNTNLFAHPYHGNLYFNSARANGLSYYEAFPCAVFGSLMWEFFGEITPPAINDLMATSVGGTCIGEVTFRISDLFYDDREMGFSRFLRELGGAIVSPMKGFKRVLTGEAWKVKSRNYLYHDYSKIPISYRVSVGNRYLADDRALFRGEHNPYLELGMDYGNVFNTDVNKPFSYFTSSITFGFSKNQPLVNRLNLLGRIWGTPISDTDKFESTFGFFQHFNFYNSEAVKDGSDLIPYRISEAASVGPGIVYRFPQLENRMNLEQRVFLSGILLGGSLSDYLRIEERDYNMGSGFSFKVQTRMDVYKIGYMNFDANYFHIFTWKGYDRREWKGKSGFDLDYTNAQGDPGNTRVMAFNLNLGLYLSHHVSFDMRGSYFMRHAHYRDFEDVKARTFEIRAGLTYKL